MLLLIGTIKAKGGAGLGLASLENEKLTLLWSDSRLVNPNWQAICPDGRIFTVHNSPEDPKKGLVSEIRVSQEGMEILSTRETQGSSPCHLARSANGRFLLCANYASGSLSVFSLEKEGIGELVQLIQHSGTGPHPTRQSSAHIHQVTRIPNLPDHFCVVDLGIDELVVYRQEENGQLTKSYAIPVPAGQGPRHVAYTSTNQAYLVTELGNRVYPVHFGEKEGFVEGNGVSTLEDPSLPNTAAALWISRDDQTLWASNRGEGTLVGFSLPELKKQAVCTLYGKEPRDFCLLEDGLMVAACQDAGLTLLQDGKILDQVEYPGAVRVQPL